MRYKVFSFKDFVFGQTLSLDCWLIRHPLVKVCHPGRWTLWNLADQDSEAQEDMHHEIESGPRPKRELGDEVHILGKKMDPFWPFLDGLGLYAPT